MKKTAVRCEDCGGEMKKGSRYHWHDDFIGDLETFALPGEYSFCAECGCETVSYSLMKRMEQAEQEKTEQLLLLRVGGDLKRYKENLIQNKDLVRLLGKSRQAIQQDGRIKTLIFHHVEKSGQILFWKKSVERYKACGDGRFSLLEEEKNPSSVTLPIHRLRLVSCPRDGGLFSSDDDSSSFSGQMEISMDRNKEEYQFNLMDSLPFVKEN